MLISLTALLATLSSIFHSRAALLSLAKTLADRIINNLQQYFQSLIWYNFGPCSARFFLWIGALIRLFRNRGNLVLENLVLRQQLAVLKRRPPRPSLGLFDKLFWVAARHFWSGWKQALIVVTPETVVRWHRTGFRLYWMLISRVRKQVGRKGTPKEVRELIFQMVVGRAADPWGTPYARF